MRIIDLSLIIDPETEYSGIPRDRIYFRPAYKTTITPLGTVEENGVFSCKLEMSTQEFTHYDAPAHFDVNGLLNHEVPLDNVVGEAVVIDMMHKKEREGVSGDDLERSGVEVRPGDIAIIRTGWTDRAWGTLKFWEDMIYLTMDAADWLIEKGIKSLAQDFMTCDPPLSPPPERKWPAPNWAPNHKKFLLRGICLIEWCTNLGAIKEQRVLLICAPLKLKGTDGAPCRVMAIEGLL
jgi:kynurenine formamidase